MSSEAPQYLPVNHVFVDLENVKSIDASVIGGRNLTCHLFLGPQNKKLDVEVVERLLENAQTVRLIRSPKAGKNALDFVLAYHLGQAVLADPKGYFHIVSKDTGFDALVDFLKSKHVKVKRHPDWNGLHFSASIKPPAIAAAVAVPKAPSKPVLSEAAEKLLENLRKSVKNRPKKEQTLVAHARSLTGKDKPEAEAGALKVIWELKKAGHLEIDPKGAVSYKL